jgi:hypothetical protein
MYLDKEINSDNLSGGALQAFPAGEYTGKFIDQKQKTYDDPAKGRLELVFEVTQGEYKGRRAFVGLNYRHPNNLTQEIAWKHLDQIRNALGLGKCDSKELLGKELLAAFKVKPDQNGQHRNEFSYAKPLVKEEKAPVAASTVSGTDEWN